MLEQPLGTEPQTKSLAADFLFVVIREEEVVRDRAHGKGRKVEASSVQKEFPGLIVENGGDSGSKGKLEQRRQHRALNNESNVRPPLNDSAISQTGQARFAHQTNVSVMQQSQFSVHTLTERRCEVCGSRARTGPLISILEEKVRAVITMSIPTPINTRLTVVWSGRSPILGVSCSNVYTMGMSMRYAPAGAGTPVMSRSPGEMSEFS